MKNFNTKSKRILAFMLMFIICLTGTAGMCSTKSQAASASVTIALSKSSIQKGDSVTATVKISCSDAIGAVSFCLSYNSSILEYTGGSGAGGGGTVMYAGYGDGSATSISASFTFKAISTGTASLSTGSTEVYAWDESYCSVTNAGCSVTVAAAGGGGGGTTEKPTTEAPATTETPSTESPNTEQTGTEATTEEDTTESYSDNCYLKSLEITPGTFTPAFSKDCYDYEAIVPSDTESLAINALPEDDTALVSIEGNSDFVAEEINKVKIIVTAETGSQKTYYLNVSMEEAEDTRVFVTLNGVEYYFAGDYEDMITPEGFSQTKGSYQGNEITMFKSPNGAVNCVCLTNDDGDINWYVYNEAEESFEPFIEVSASYNRYLILTPGTDVAIPDGYDAFTYTLDGNDITAYRQNENDEIFLIYAMNIEGEAGFYRYDTAENTFLRYVSDIAATSAEEVSADEPQEEKGFLEKYKNIIAIAAIILFAIMLIVIISLAVVLAKVSKKYNAAGEETADADAAGEETADADATGEENADATADETAAGETDDAKNDDATADESAAGETAGANSDAIDELIDSAFSGIRFTPHISKNSKPRMTTVPVQNQNEPAPGGSETITAPGGSETITVPGESETITAPDGSETASDENGQGELSMNTAAGNPDESEPASGENGQGELSMNTAAGNPDESEPASGENDPAPDENDPAPDEQ